MVELTKEEIWASSILNSQISNTQAELQRAIAAKDAYIKLLENKYDAVFDSKSGVLKEKEKSPQ